MSVDVLQDKIRKKKNPAMLLLSCDPGEVPGEMIVSQGSMARACVSYFGMLLAELQDLIPAVRVSFSSFALLGPEGLEVLPKVLQQASDLGYYVALDAPEILTPQAAAVAAEVFLKDVYRFDGLVISGYLGSDILKAFLPLCRKQMKDVFVVARTGNRSASELQDLLTGSRLVHMAAADQVNRCAGDYLGKHGFSQVGIVAGASSSESLRLLRSTYPQLFMLLDGVDYPNANARNCSFAFDQFGHGAAACVGSSITGAWKKEESPDYRKNARAAADRMRKNLTRYISIL